MCNIAYTLPDKKGSHDIRICSIKRLHADQLNPITPSLYAGHYAQSLQYNRKTSPALLSHPQTFSSRLRIYLLTSRRVGS